MERFKSEGGGSDDEGHDDDEESDGDKDVHFKRQKKVENFEHERDCPLCADRMKRTLFARKLIERPMGALSTEEMNGVLLRGKVTHELRNPPPAGATPLPAPTVVPRAEVGNGAAGSAADPV